MEIRKERYDELVKAAAKYKTISNLIRNYLEGNDDPAIYNKDDRGLLELCKHVMEVEI